MKTIVYFADSTELTDEALFRCAFDRQSPARQSKIGKFRQERDRRLSLAAGLLLQMALREAGIPESEASIREGEQGKPYLTEHEDIFFNISHSGERAMCVVSDRETGCDVEIIDPHHNTEGVAKYSFSDREREWLDAVPQAERLEAFFRLWTLKESLLKTTGTGFSVPIREISLCIEEHGVRAEGSGLTGSYSFFEPELPGPYRCACCFAGPLPDTPEVRFVNLRDAVEAGQI